MAGMNQKTKPRTNFGRRLIANLRYTTKLWVLRKDKCKPSYALSRLDTTEGPQRMYEATYREDLAIYGEPDNTIPLTLMQDVEGWLTTLNKAMEK